MCGSWNVYVAILGEESNLVIHNQQEERLHSEDRVGSLEHKNISGSPSGKSGPKKMLLDSLTGPKS